MAGVAHEATVVEHQPTAPPVADDGLGDKVALRNGVGDLGSLHQKGESFHLGPARGRRQRELLTENRGDSVEKANRTARSRRTADVLIPASAMTKLQEGSAVVIPAQTLDLLTGRGGRVEAPLEPAHL